MLKETYLNLLSNYTDNENILGELWSEIEKKYSSSKRHYHTLAHLENLLHQLVEVKQEIQHWESVLFTLYYHDIVYQAEKSNNEEKSSELAQKRMEQLAVPLDVIERCKKQILATKSHVQSEDNNVNYFNDADLSILGQDWESYYKYAQNVRKEYAMYPNFLYKSGRIKVLKHFLAMERIFKTDHFYKQFESQAKQNLQREIDLLNG